MLLERYFTLLTVSFVFLPCIFAGTISGDMEKNMLMADSYSFRNRHKNDTVVNKTIAELIRDAEEFALKAEEESLQCLLFSNAAKRDVSNGNSFCASVNASLKKAKCALQNSELSLNNKMYNEAIVLSEKVTIECIRIRFVGKNARDAARRIQLAFKKTELCMKETIQWAQAAQTNAFDVEEKASIKLGEISKSSKKSETSFQFFLKENKCHCKSLTVCFLDCICDPKVLLFRKESILAMQLEMKNGRNSAFYVNRMDPKSASIASPDSTDKQEGEINESTYFSTYRSDADFSKLFNGEGHKLTLNTCLMDEKTRDEEDLMNYFIHRASEVIDTTQSALQRAAVARNSVNKSIGIATLMDLFMNDIESSARASEGNAIKISNKAVEEESVGRDSSVICKWIDHTFTITVSVFLLLFMK